MTNPSTTAIKYSGRIFNQALQSYPAKKSKSFFSANIIPHDLRFNQSINYYPKAPSYAVNRQQAAKRSIINGARNYSNNFKDFHNLDNITAADANFLIDSMMRMYKYGSIKEIKEEALTTMVNRLADKSSYRILEAACGHGADARRLVELFPDATKVKIMAVDLSERMITEARGSSQHPKIDYQTVDIMEMENLGYRNYFDACHTDRLLVSSNNYEKLFHSILRLVKPGGIVTITDVDAHSIIIYPETKTCRIIRDEVVNKFVNPDMGRKLPQLFVENGLSDVEVFTRNSSIRSFSDLCSIFPFTNIIDELEEKHKLEKGEGEKWLKNMSFAQEIGVFLYWVNFVTVSGRVPVLNKAPQKSSLYGSAYEYFYNTEDILRSDK